MDPSSATHRGTVPNDTRQTPGQVSLHVCASGDFGVAQADDGGLRLVTLRGFAAGQTLFTIEGRLGAQASRYSLQVGDSLHVDLGPQLSQADILAHHYWRFMNHSCEPSVEVHGLKVVAARELIAGDGVTFDYNTTEWDMAEPFRCRCGSAACLGIVQGYKHLSAAQRARLCGVAPYLLAAST